LRVVRRQTHSKLNTDAHCKTNYNTNTYAHCNTKRLAVSRTWIDLHENVN
jgi:hypothetical protein